MTPSPTTTSPAPTAASPEKQSDFKEVIDFVKTLVKLFVVVFIIRACIVEPFKIPSGSMIPTLQIGDHIIVSKLSYGFRLPLVKDTLFRWSSPKRGDVVVFMRLDDTSTEEDESAINVIKRVIGLPGDLVEVRDTKLYINNELYPETYSRWEDGGSREGNFGPERVPENHLFMLGDNRDHSKDSRFWQDPFLPLDRVKGRALAIYFSWYSLKRIGTVIR